MKLILLLICFLIYSAAQAQTAVDSVKNTVNNLFLAMKTSDSVLLQSVFTDNAILQTIQKDQSGKVIIKTEKINEFAGFVGKQEKGILNEQITFEIVKTDADLATAWTPYKFYYKNKFSHCGVNSFQLVRIGGIWKIQYLVDTRRIKGCE